MPPQKNHIIIDELHCDAGYYSERRDKNCGMTCFFYKDERKLSVPINNNEKSDRLRCVERVDISEPIIQTELIKTSTDMPLSAKMYFQEPIECEIEYITDSNRKMKCSRPTHMKYLKKIKKARETK